MASENGAMAEREAEIHAQGELIAALRARVAQFESLLADVACMGVEHDDPRIGYVTVQIGRDTLADIRAALAATPADAVRRWKAMREVCEAARRCRSARLSLPVFLRNESHLGRTAGELLPEE